MRTFVSCFGGILGLLAALTIAPASDSLRSGFLKPPPEARPWVYWFWLNGNITSNGITADLEAMRRVGIGGVLIMEVDQGAPVGPVDFMSQRWRDLFKHVHLEARRLGLEVNMNNDAGWNGSGGPWIKPEQSMQEVVWSETELVGPRLYEGRLPQPESSGGYYRDISVLAFPTVGNYRIPNIATKAAAQRHDQLKASTEKFTDAMIITPAAITNLSPRMDDSGRLTWEVPSGNWTVLRFGHTSTGVENSPAPPSGRGLECDKLSREGIEANFAGLMAKLATDNRLKPGNSKRGLVATHIDSWENGSQNWTAAMRQEFRRRRGYDLLPYLPVLTGRVVGGPDISERFLWDVRRTVSELIIENYAGHFRELAHAAGLRFTVEAYGSPCDSIPYAGQSDEPMGEFWTPGGSAMETCRVMASAGHVYGQRIIGAESFTSGDRERWLEHPALLKSHGDRAFCEGINRFVFHRYALQPWTESGRAPGMTMGPWGQHYERTQTWWEWTPAWHEYLARCQFLLRQGRFVADICYVQPETPPQGPGDHKRGGYNWDECTTEEVVTRMTVKDGRIVLPDGMNYRLLALPWSQTMTPRLLRKVRELVQAGATVLGPKPAASPSLSDYPRCDAEVRELAAQLWGDTLAIPHRLGSGRVLVSDAPEKVLADTGIAPDFSSGQPLRFIHRTTGAAEIYFVANLEPYAFTTTCSFRVSDREPELWWPRSGRMEPAAMWEEKDGVTRVVVPFEENGSVFVVFRTAPRNRDPLTQIKRNGQEVLSTAPPPPLKVLVNHATYGVLGDPARSRDVTAKVQHAVDAGEFNFAAKQMAEGDDPAPGTIKLLQVDYEIADRQFRVRAQDPWTIHLSRDAVNIEVAEARYGMLDDPKRTRDVREKVQQLADSGASSFQVAQMAAGDDPAFLVVKTLKLTYKQNGELHQLTGIDPETINLSPATAPPTIPIAVRCSNAGAINLQMLAAGDYELRRASGKTQRVKLATIPDQLEIPGPWQVRFAPRRGAPAELTFAKLISWSSASQPEVKFFSGEATYRNDFHLSHELLKSGYAIQLDLGKVAVMAEVKLNGKSMGTLWKPPFVVDITSKAKVGLNQLEVRVVNLWPNRLIGDEQLPDDTERNPDGTLKKWPEWVRHGKTSPTGRSSFTTWRLWKANDPLIESGLIGPVNLRFVPEAGVH